VDTLVGLIAILVGLVVIGFAVSTLFRLVTVHDYERGLRYSSGRFRGLVPSGSHIVFRPFGELRVLDARPAHLTLEGQEVLLADGASVKVSIVARYVLADPVSAMTGAQDAWHALYLELQLRLREVLVGRTLDQVLADRTTLGGEIRERSASGVAALGLELLSVDVRDLMLAGDLRRAFAAVVAARKEGEAALERARGETAALRNLANAGRILDDNPGLLQLRLLQHVGGTSGNTLMVNVPDGVARTTGQGGIGKTARDAGSASPEPPATSASPRVRRRPT
jgi:regulator of protease activity HflC (stomatin/prohibitin superfamily)